MRSAGHAGWSPRRCRKSPGLRKATASSGNRASTGWTTMCRSSRAKAGNMSAKASSSADREVIITRIINAPLNVVFDAWVNSKHADKWMGPAGYTTVTQSMDVRPGGMWRFTMSGPQGVFPSRVTYIEVVRPSRLVYMHGADQDNDPEAFHVTVTF